MKNNDIKFEDAISKLETIVSKLENGSLSLDEAILKYEEAVELIRVCNNKLENAEQKVRLLVEAEDGTVTDAPFNRYGDEN